MSKPLLSIINNKVRFELKLSIVEYYIADCISRFSNRESWSSIKYNELSELVDLSPRQIIRHIRKLEELGFVEQNKKKYRITKLWIETVETFAADKMSVPIVAADKMSVPENPYSISTNILLSTKGVSTIPLVPVSTNSTKSISLNIDRSQEKKTFGQKDINDVINYLKSKIGMELDGGGKNRWFASHLLKAVKRNFPSLNAVDKVKEIIDIGYEISFFKQSLTNTTYLYYNWVKILKQGEDMGLKNENYNVDNLYQKRIELSKDCKLGCKNGYIQKEVNGREVIVLCECCKNLH